ncbi:hypothetical protein BJV74DRAFT_92863 [Russula compacta]|nr:hypothetical protein BJV74DRAFT_92863 [Russula compacta]
MPNGYYQNPIHEVYLWDSTFRSSWCYLINTNTPSLISPLSLIIASDTKTLSVACCACNLRWPAIKYDPYNEIQTHHTNVTPVAVLYYSIRQTVNERPKWSETNLPKHPQADPRSRNVRSLSGPVYPSSFCELSQRLYLSPWSDCNITMVYFMYPRRQQPTAAAPNPIKMLMRTHDADTRPLQLAKWLLAFV